MHNDGPQYLSVGDVIALHRYVMERLGTTAAPLRDEAALEGALMRPQMAAYYETADVVRQCAVLAIGISQAQAFTDGNKRTAFAAVRAFLRRNGLHYAGPPLMLAEQLEAVATRPDSLADATDRFESWFRARIAPLS